ncbi:hypothetical protein RUM43_013771 [Polyplax serrata]|uniref:BSD domain-containing protein n=1 Tax=Polyplax serrata TaxID=468196 RepID=A0AAN8S667_POLSC
MFSGITNQMSQVSSWIGAKKGDIDTSKSVDEKVISPNTETQDASAEGTSPTAPKGSKFEVLSNVKGQMTSWIGSVQVPSVPNIFNKGNSNAAEAQAPEGSGDGKTDSPTSGESVKGSPEHQKHDDDDNSSLLKVTNEAFKEVTAPFIEFSNLVKKMAFSATGGADSDAAVEEDDQGEEGKESGIGGVSTKAVQGAKTIGNFLFSAVNKAGETVSKAGAKIKKTVEENSILGDFNKEQEAFIKEQQSKLTDAAVPPWVGVPNEESLKQDCLSLSTDIRHFVRAPPPGVDFPFDYEASYKVALATLAEDPNLEKMRYDLVPKVVSEENFWRNYFYRVSLLRQQAELDAMQPTQPSRTSSVDAEPAEEEWERELEAELKDYEVVAGKQAAEEPDVEDEDIEDLK